MEKFRQLITLRSHPIDAVRCFFHFLLLLGRMQTVLESKKSILQKYSGSQKLSQIGKSRLFSYIF